MSSLSDALHTARPPAIEPKGPDVPKGWEPGLTWSNETETGTITTPAMSDEPDDAVWEQILTDFGPKAKRLEIIDSTIEFVGWNAMTGKHTDPPNQIVRMKRYKAKLRRRSDTAESIDITALCDYVRKRKPPRKQPAPVEDIERAFLVLLSDWQAGKNEGEGKGSEAFLERVLVAFDRSIDRLAELKKNGRPCQVVYLVGLGDLVEGCRGMSNASQEWTTDLTRRQQITLVVDLLVKLVDLMVDAGYRVVLTGVAGNHGEHRNSAGKAFTTDEDNDDLLVIELAGRVFRGNPERYGAGVTVYLPEELSMSIDICGVICGFYHGHIGSAKTNTLTKLSNWWTGQIVGNLATAPASILFSGHFHHLHVTEASGRTMIQAPAMDGGSSWFSQISGKSSAPGFLTMTIGGPTCGPRGFDDLRVA